MAAKKNTPADKLKKLEEQIARKKAELIRERGRLSENARKNRMRRMIHVGELAEIAGIIDCENAFLLGVLLKAKEVDSDSAEWRELHKQGEIVLKEREASRRKDVLKQYVETKATHEPFSSQEA